MLYLLIFAIVLSITITCAGYKNRLIDDKILFLNEEFKNGKLSSRELVYEEQHFIHNKEGNVGLAIVAAIGVPFCIFNIKFVLGLLLVTFAISILVFILRAFYNIGYKIARKLNDSKTE